MSDQPESLVLQLLRALRIEVAELRHEHREDHERLIRIELAVAGLRRDAAHDAEARAESEVRFDRLRQRLERIERRLDLTGTEQP
jgi:hypothetical protein